MPHVRAVELWRPIPGYEGRYEASDQGRVRSVNRVVICGRGGAQRRRGRILKQYKERDGYLTVPLGSRNKKSVHRLVLLAHVGPPPPGHECCHGDGVRSNNRLSNLRWGTRPENMRDKLLHGTNYAVNKVKCPRGHALEAPNLVPSSKTRLCLACRRALQRAKWHEYSSPEELQAYADAQYVEIMKGPVERPLHGTRNAYERERRLYHLGRGPAPCEACTAANRERNRQWKQAVRAR
jgi:hypothetical protein